MKRKILSALLLTMSVTALSCGYAFAAETTPSTATKTAVEDTNKPPVDENAVVGVVKSVSGSSITVETMKGRPDGEKPADGEEPPAKPDGEKPADGEEPPAKPDGEKPADGEEPPAKPDGEKPADGEEPPTKPDGEKPADGEEPPVKPDGEKPDNANKPETEEKTVLITSSTLIYSEGEGTTNKTDLSSLKEGTMVRIELADGSSKDDSTVKAKTITVSDRKEKTDDKIKDDKKITDNKSTAKTTA